VYGFYVKHKEHIYSSVDVHYILHYEADVSFWDRVDPGTVGECTGLTDKNGKLIFEGDIVRMPHEYMTTEKIKGCFGYDSEGYPQRIPGYEGSGEYPTVKRGFKNCPVKFNPSRGFYAEGTSFFLGGINVEAIGNVVDHPELLKGGEG
jgi:uncharacterized phage protein (TIGR01671 family)